MLTKESVGKIFKDNQGNDIFIFKECNTCCRGVRYYGTIENDPSDNFFAYNQQGIRLDHRGNPSKDKSTYLILGE